MQMNTIMASAGSWGMVPPVKVSPVSAAVAVCMMNIVTPATKNSGLRPNLSVTHAKVLDMKAFYLHSGLVTPILLLRVMAYAPKRWQAEYFSSPQTHMAASVALPCQQPYACGM